MKYILLAALFLACNTPDATDFDVKETNLLPDTPIEDSAYAHLLPKMRIQYESVISWRLDSLNNSMVPDTVILNSVIYVSQGSTFDDTYELVRTE